jgi:hypothetical protein
MNDFRLEPPTGYLEYHNEIRRFYGLPDLVKIEWSSQHSASWKEIDAEMERLIETRSGKTELDPNDAPIGMIAVQATNKTDTCIGCDLEVGDDTCDCKKARCMPHQRKDGHSVVFEWRPGQK